MAGVGVIPIPAFPIDLNARLFFGAAGNAVEFDKMVVEVPGGGNVPADDEDEDEDEDD